MGVAEPQLPAPDADADGPKTRGRPKRGEFQDHGVLYFEDPSSVGMPEPQLTACS